MEKDESREAAPTPRHSWDMLLTRSRSQRAELRAGLAPPFSRLSLVPTATGCRVYALGTPYSQPNQTLLAADVCADASEHVQLKPVLDTESLKSSTPNQEFSLLCERQRMSVVSGVTDYSIDPVSGTVLITAGEQLLKLPQGSASPTFIDLDLDEPSFIFDAKICPSNPAIISYVINKQVHLDVNGLKYHTTSESGEIHNGVASFIAQEELDRFDATWWSPTLPRLLYERIDDSKVKSLNFACPGKENSSPMKYPLAGTDNSVSTLRQLIVDNDQILDIGLKTPLSEQFPWLEYIARAGYLNDGRTVWLQALDREQTRCALIVIPESEFEGFSVSGDCPVTKATIVHEETTASWINTHNTIIPLDSPDSSSISFIYLSECDNQCHLYRIGVNINPSTREVIGRISSSITSGDYSVCKSTSAVYDHERQLLFYAASPTNPTETAVCVADLSDFNKITTKQLTPSNLSFKYERSYHVLALVPGVGFACWMTSVDKPLACHFYSFTPSSESRLPNAKLSAIVGLQNTTPTTNFDGRELPKFFFYTSKNSGVQHVAMMLTPPDYDQTKKYPVVHYVYGGPGIQLVKNDYASWIPFQKYTRLGYVVVVVDGRGSSNRGRSFEQAIKKNLGGPETEDQVEGLMEVARRSSGLIDLDRVVVHGWSYGGYLSLMMLAKHPNIYRAAIAGGAVVDWELYDTAYTERYLGYPISHVYEECSIPKYVDRLPNEPGRLLVIHGFVDENVHFRHTEVLVDALLKHGKPYQLQIFPQERHGIRSTEAAAHLDATMLHFIQQALAPKWPNCQNSH